MPKYPLIHVKYARKILKSTRRSCKHLAIQNFSRKEMITSFTWHEMRQFQQPHHYTVCQWGFYPIVKTCKNWVMTLSSSMAMYSVMRDIPDARKGTNRKRMSCSSPICHMHIFKSFDFYNGPLNMDYLYFDTHCTGPRFWNSLDNEIKDARSLPSFKIYNTNY